MIRLLIVDDHAIVRRGLKRIFEMESDLVVSAEAANASDALTWVGANPVDLVLLDLTMPGTAGVDVVKQLRAMRSGLPILVLSMHAEAQVAARALRAGANGYITKDNTPEVLLQAVYRVAAGGRFVDAALVEELVFEKVILEPQPTSSLTDREFEVFRLLASGASVTEIAENFLLSAKTISTYKMRLMQKLGLKNNTEIIHLAIRQGLIDSAEQ
jgi:DNA-binding NarL/FixJ family response regulator